MCCCCFYSYCVLLYDDGDVTEQTVGAVDVVVLPTLILQLALHNCFPLGMKMASTLSKNIICKSSANLFVNLFVFYILTGVYGQLTEIDNLALPIEWNEIPINSQHTSMSTILDSSGIIYLCGGKISLYDKSSTCIGIQIERNNDENNSLRYLISETYSGGNGIKSSGFFPNLYLNAKGFISESQNEGGIYNDRLCMLSISDGTNNQSVGVAILKKHQYVVMIYY